MIVSVTGLHSSKCSWEGNRYWQKPWTVWIRSNRVCYSPHSWRHAIHVCLLLTCSPVLVEIFSHRVAWGDFAQTIGLHQSWWIPTFKRTAGKPSYLLPWRGVVFCYPNGKINLSCGLEGDCISGLQGCLLYKYP